MVTLLGTAFDPLSPVSKVTFNGVAANVAGASAEGLMVSVPSGATSGKVSVTNASGIFVSATDFVVSGSSPVITGLSPAAGVAGTVLEISGTDLGGSAADTRAELNSRIATVQSVSPSTVMMVIPGKAGSGRVRIITPYGAGSSNMDFFIPPTPYDVDDIAIGSRIAIGETRTVAIGLPGKIGLVLFDAVAGQRIGMRLSRTTMESGTISILKPDGATHASIRWSAGSEFIDAPALPSTGTYTILVEPAASLAGSVDIGLHEFQDVAATIAIGGPSVAVSTSMPGQEAELTFSASAGQRFSVRVAEVGSGGNVTMTMFRPDGAVLTSASSQTSAGVFTDVLTAPSDGPCRMRLRPQGMASSTVVTQLYDVPSDINANIAMDGPPVTVQTGIPGQNANLSFTATAGQRISIMFSGASAANAFAMSVVRPDGRILRSSGALSPNGTFIDVTDITLTGSYVIRINPVGMAVGSVTTRLYAVPPDSTGVMAIGGSTVTAATTVPGKNARLTFNAAAGQRFGMQFSDIAGGSYVDMSLVGPDGAKLVASTPVSAGKYIDVIEAPLSGAYVVMLNFRGVATGTVGAQLHDVSADPIADVAIGGAPVTMTATIPGQNAYLRFSGSAGERLSMQFSGVTAGTYVDMSVIRPDGSLLTAPVAISSAGRYVDAKELPQSGMYTIKLDWRGSAIGTVATRLFAVPDDVVADLVSGGVAIALSTVAPGQNLKGSFAGTAGQIVAPYFSGNTLGCVAPAVNGPDGALLMSASTCAASYRFTATTLPTTGVYTISIVPGGAKTGRITLGVANQ